MEKSSTTKYKSQCTYPRCECMHSADGCGFAKMEAYFITNPHHGGKVPCHKCNGFIEEGDGEGYWDHQHRDEFPRYWFHKKCFNRYEHYYGIDKPLD